ncbi:putative late blight resistance protein homolog R1A-3 [Salvia hispanica]|uniref:putative late blight resistance protein homolog R1A-3 n=1 Tax=Salvia hispanica TaxID=49212 RepID=UPI002008F342|nr:putative late blight resistance protein homolog R1A-3 [Salvia hispanica]
MAIPDVVGLNQDLIKIADRLTGGPSHLQVIPIVGMGGIGKTTLAKNVYHHPLTTDAFMVRAWVTVSQDYKPQSIYTALLACFKQVENESSGQEKVHKFLKGRKYLIVLDDLWSHGAWDDASICLPDDGNGSRVVITTRLVDVATYAGSSSDVHRMRFMGWDESWDLLKKKVFPSSDCPSYLVHIGMKISRRCGGLPLAVVLVAGMLSTVLKTGFS